MPGQFGPYTQSQRLLLYHTHANMLVQNGSAYKCFCSSDRLQILRATARKDGTASGYDGSCRTLSHAEAEERSQSGEPFVVRLRVDHDLIPLIRFHDIVYGDMQVL